MTRRTITTDAIGRQEATPDLAAVKADAIGEGDSAAVAHAAVRDRTETIRESVTSVSTDQIQTTDIQVQKTSHIFDPETDAPYQATESFRIECVPETVESVVLEVADAGGSVTSVQFELHRDVSRRLQNEALAAAMERAREKAEHIAAAEGVALGDIKNVATGDAYSETGSLFDDALDALPDVNCQSTSVTVAASVEVVYELVTK